ncbi:MAG: rhomboid family intramembrane serine protease [Victivallaceae bacterium]|nr:rhomboid family intramembrane serine protease [Victivallaceae bacterium]
MQEGQGNMFRRINPAEGRTTVIGLIVINVLVYLFTINNQSLFNLLALSTVNLRHGYWFELVTAMFMHGGLLHLAFNMWALYLFGMIVAPLLGRARFLALYFISGLLGNLVYVAVYWNIGASLVGASGAIFGVMMAVAMLAPNIPFVLLIFPVPIKARTLVIVVAILEIFNEISGQWDGVAHLAHLGGFIGGYFFIKFVLKRSFRFDLFRFMRPGPKLWKNEDEPKDSGRNRLDALLDKISRHGINSLTQEEMEFLRQARERMRGDRESR